MEIRKAQITDAPAILELIEEARALFKIQGVPQWNNGYPNLDTINQDISNGTNYVLIDTNKIIGTAVIMLDDDPNYLDIYNGAWLLPTASYLTIHRITISSDYRGLGLAKYFFDYAKELGKTLNYQSIRIDTHELNHGMQHWIKKCGFTYCGNIMVSDKTWRLAYEYQL